MTAFKSSHSIAAIIVIGLFIGRGLASPLFAKPVAEKDPRVALAARAAEEFIAVPRLPTATKQYETWLAGQSYESVVSAYEIFQRISLRQPVPSDCVRENRAIATAITANPFALAPAVLALKCAEIAGDAKLAEQVEQRIEVRLSMLFAQGRGHLMATPAKLMSWWDIPAFADISGLQWLSTRYHGALSVSDLTAYATFESESNSAAQLSQASYYFDIFGEKFRAGLSTRNYETPWQRLSSIQDFMQELANAGDVDAKIYLQEYEISVDLEAVPAALIALREMLKQPESALPAAMSLVLIAARNKEIKLVESDLDPLFEGALVKNFQALEALVLERCYGLVEPADFKEAETLLEAAKKISNVSSVISQLVLLGSARQESVPEFALRALEAEVKQKQPVAIVTANIVGAGYKTLPKGGEWIGDMTGDPKRLNSLKGATRAVTFFTLAAIQPDVPNAKEMACEAAAFPVVRAKLLCSRYLASSSQQRLRYLIESAGEGDLQTKDGEISRIAVVSSDLGEYFEALRPAEPRAPDLDRAAEWALSAVTFGESKSYHGLARLALRGAKLSEFDWNLIRQLFAEQKPVAPDAAKTELALAFGGSTNQPKLVAELNTKCVAKDANACEVLSWAHGLSAPNSQQQAKVLNALKLCVQATDYLVKTDCALYLGLSYIAGEGVKKDVARGLAYIEKLPNPSVAAINDMAWIRCTAPAPPLFDPAKVTKYWPKLIPAKVPHIQDTLAACYAANGMFDLAAGMLEKIIADLPAEAVKTQADGNKMPTVKQRLQQHLKSYVGRKRWVQLDLGGAGG